MPSSFHELTGSRPYRPHGHLRGYRAEVVGGSSYIQLVTFSETGPQARGLLAFSQSTDRTSSHQADQTRLFSKQEWPLLPFGDEQIQADLKQLQRIEE